MAGLWHDKNKNRWRVSFLAASGERLRKFFKLKINAQDYLRVVEDREERLKHRLGWIEPITYADALPLYKAEYLNLKSKSHSHKAYQKLGHLSSYFKPSPICEVTPNDIDFIIRALVKKELSNKTINDYRSLLRGLFRWACKKGFAVENPVDQTDALPKLPRSFRRAYTVEEIQSLMAHVCPCCMAAVVVLANTGVRLGELEHLTTDDFDLERKVLFISHTEATPIKGRKSRIIPLNDVLIKLIQGCPEGKILQIPRKTFETHFRHTRDRAKIKDAIPHGLRHSFTSHLIESGLDLGKVQRITGHQHISTLQKYLHSTGSDLIEYRNNIQFEVPVRCPTPTSIRTKRGEMGLPEQDGNEIFQQLRKIKELQMCRGGESNPHALADFGF
jgi:integrase/recombinase XerD